MLASSLQDRALLLPTEAEMLPKDKYTTFNPTSTGYRKSVHRVPKFTKVCLLGVANGEDRMLIDVAVDAAREPYRFLSLKVDDARYPRVLRLSTCLLESQMSQSIAADLLYHHY